MALINPINRLKLLSCYFLYYKNTKPLVLNPAFHQQICQARAEMEIVWIY